LSDSHNHHHHSNGIREVESKCCDQPRGKVAWRPHFRLDFGLFEDLSFWLFVTLSFCPVLLLLLPLFDDVGASASAPPPPPPGPEFPGTPSKAPPPPPPR